MEETKVWVNTATIHSILHPDHSHPTRRLGMHGSLVDEHCSDDTGGGDSIRKINWGWVPATITSGGHSGNDGALDATASITVRIEDEESEYHRTTLEIPGGAIEKGHVVMANYHGDEDGEDLGFDSEDDDDQQAFGLDGEPLGYPDDLITLTHLHEPAVLHCLRKRFDQDKIYTNTGPILIALNPFKSCKSLYSDTIMKRYWERGEAQMLMGGSGEGNNGGGGGRDGDMLAPHVYDLADGTYRSMMLKIDLARAGEKCDQSILVSGESGAGKTVTTKFIMQYLATLSERRVEAKAIDERGGKPSSSAPKKRTKKRQSIDLGLRGSFQKEDDAADTSIEQQVLQSNPILESFGNARTIRNDNSSRFGKFIEIRFDPTGTLVGASIETYLLEKVRLISQAEGERNYHVFYEMLSGMTEDELDQFLLGNYTAEDFKITSCSGTYDRRDGVQDTDTFEDLVDALEVMGFTQEQQDDVFSIASAVLHLSNLSINPIKGGEECEIDAENEHLEPILKLLGVTKENLNQALCYFKIEARGQSYTRAVQKDKAEKGLEALMKATYSAIFDYIVKRINASITVKKKGSRSETGGGRRSKGGDSGNAFIGVLDIFGFESFKVNSFEQLCINYCNEALQQQFNLFVLKNEQDEYEQEGIKWSFISFPDNQDALDLIWKKGYGILNILDDQCRAPGTTDKTFANDLYQKLQGKPRFEANFRQVGARQFGVFHYAGLVEYETDGFVEKNRDELPKEASDVLLSSSSDFVKELASIIQSSSAQDKPTSGRAKKNATVGGHFAKQLQELRVKIDLTSPHYVRCLKPNAQLVPDNFDPQMIVEQLRCAGVVEAVRVSRVGYPQRYSHSQFISRYRTLGLREMKKASKAKTKVKPIAVLVDAIAKKMALIDFKTTAADEKSGKKSKGDDKVDLSAIGVQVGKTKVFLRRRAFDIIEKMRKDYMVTAARKVQAVARGYIQYRTFHEYCEANLQLQCWTRVILAERKVQAARECFNATRIQGAYRKFAARQSYCQILIIARWCQRMHRGAVGRAQYKALDRLRRAVISVQCAVRVRKAVQVLDSLKAEAKNLSNISEERDKFRNRMEEMRLEMERMKMEKKKEAEEAARKKATESDTSKLKDEIQRLINELSITRKQLVDEQHRSQDALVSMQAKEAELEEAKESLDGLRCEIGVLKSQAVNFQAAATGSDEEEDVLRKLNDALAESAERGKEIRKLKKELRNSSSVSKPQSTSEPSEELSVLKRELEATKAQLVAAQKSEKSTKSSGDVVAGDSASASKPDKDLKKENSKMKKEITKLKEANKKILETAEEQFASLVDLENKNATLRKEIDGMQDASVSGLAADASAYSTLKKCLDEVEARLKAEQVRSESAIARETKLRNEVAELRLRSPKKNGKNTATVAPQTIGEDEAADDVATLQFEVERLRRELEAAKDEAINAKNNTSADEMIHKYDELRRLAEAGMQKDIEIQELKLRVSTQDAQLRSIEEETTNEDDLCFGIRQYREDGDDIAAAENEGLRSLNEELQRQLQVYKKEAEGAQNKLKEEAERSDMEMKAFSVALKGVDDLRVAAEHMSRELHHIKKHGYVPPGGLTGEDTSTNVQSAMSAVRTMATANQSIDHPSANAPSQQGFSLWAAMNSVLGSPRLETERHEPFAPDPTIEDERRSASKKKSKKKKKKRGDEGSIISSFF
eukprot:scaffold15769_cov135-Skeletonema_menzelii.AAC.3